MLQRAHEKTVQSMHKVGSLTTDAARRVGREANGAVFALCYSSRLYASYLCGGGCSFWGWSSLFDGTVERFCVSERPGSIVGASHYGYDGSGSFFGTFYTSSTKQSMNRDIENLSLCLLHKAKFRRDANPYYNDTKSFAYLFISLFALESLLCLAALVASLLLVLCLPWLGIAMFVLSAILIGALFVMSIAVSVRNNTTQYGMRDLDVLWYKSDVFYHIPLESHGFNECELRALQEFVSRCQKQDFAQIESVVAMACELRKVRPKTTRFDESSFVSDQVRTMMLNSMSPSR